MKIVLTIEIGFYKQKVTNKEQKIFHPAPLTKLHMFNKYFKRSQSSPQLSTEVKNEKKDNNFPQKTKNTF